MIGDVSRRGLMGVAAAAPILWTMPDARAAAAERRLFFTPKGLARALALKQSGALAGAWGTLRSAATAATRAPGLFSTTYDPTRWWQRYVGWSMSNCSAAYLLGGDIKDRDLAIQLATMASDYTLWGGSSSIYDGDLNASDLLFGICMVVDWLGAELPAATRAKLIATLRQRGAHMATFASGIGGSPAWWYQDYLQNHLWDNVTGLLTTGLALQNDAPDDAARFISAAMNCAAPAFAALMPDGGTQESPTYWEFTADSVLKFHHLATELLGATISPLWMRRAAAYRIAMALPLAAATKSASVVNQSDGSVTPWFGPEYQLRRLAALNHDGNAQYLADQLEAKGLVYPSAPWLNFVWYDPKVPAATTPPPLLKPFTDLDLVVARSDRRGNESMVVMRAGPSLGKQAQLQHYDHEVGLGHCHQDVNHITLFAGGHFLLRDDGYATKKLTVQHNTLLVNGFGQLYEGGTWTNSKIRPLPDQQPTLTIVNHFDIYDYWVGEGAAAYAPSTALTRFDRHVIFIKPNVLVVIDDLAATKTSKFTLLWHTSAAPTAGVIANQYLVAFPGFSLVADFVLPAGAQTTLGSRQFQVSVAPGMVPEIMTSMDAQATQAGAVFAWGVPGTIEPATLTRSGADWIIATRSHTFTVTLATRNVVVT